MKTNRERVAGSNRANRWALIAWVGFLSACLLEGLVFSLVDPGEVHWSGQVLQPSRQAVYTAAFFCFWLISAASAWVVLRLAGVPPELNDIAVD